MERDIPAESPLLQSFLNDKPVRGVEFDCDECGTVGYHKPGCAVEAKRIAMQVQLDRVHVDPTKLRPRSPRRRVHVVGIEVRTAIAKEILLAMINNGGAKADKVHAAVEYTDLLLAELGGNVQPFGGDDDE